MSGLRLTVVDGGPCRLEKNKIVAFAPETVSIPTTIGIIEHPKHGLVLWDTGVNHVVADPEEGEKYWGPGIRDAFEIEISVHLHHVDFPRCRRARSRCRRTPTSRAGRSGTLSRVCL
jgi:hypothetical protein